MDLEEDYSEYDYDYIPELDHQISSKESKEYYPSEANQHVSDQFQDILFQKTNSYYTMDYGRTEKYVADMVRELTDTWGISEAHALKLLKKFSWNKDKALSHLTEDGNFELMEVKGDKNSKEFTCPVCFSTEPVKEGCSFECGHLYCRECFLGYIDVSIQEGQILKPCPTNGCQEMLTPKIAERYLKISPSLYEKYRRFLLQTVVDTSQDLMWCPAAKCHNIIHLLKMRKDEPKLRNIRCDCGHCFCFQCRDVAHRPLKCEKFKKWMTMVGGKDDSLNEGWIKKNTKKCPQCNISIEKNQGCMHMTCRNCKHEFCWLCNGDWKQHGSQTGGYYDCNKFKKNDKLVDDDEREFEKFSFYRDRFEQHWNALNFAVKKRGVILENFKSINELVHQMKDDSFLREALDLIIEARRAITMTYAVAYFIRFTEVEKEMFEMQQSMLWEALDNLDKFTDEAQVQERFMQILIDEVQGVNYLAGKFNDYKSNLNGRVAGVTAACNKLLRYIEEELQDRDLHQIKVEEKPKLKKNNSMFENEYWYCAHCTYANPKSKKKCEMCDNTKKVLKNPVF